MSFFTWKDNGLTSDCSSLDAMASRFEETANLMKKLSKKGFKLKKSHNDKLILHPDPKVFMGDTGSLSIGAILGSIALLTDSVFTLSIFSGIFIIESLSVIIQVGFFKITKKLFYKGKRIFLMAPLHHHFELKGVKEDKIVENFWKINILLIILGIVLKINL